MSSVDKKDDRVILLYIITGLHTGGAEMMLYNIVSGINRQKFIPHVISLAGGGPIAEQLKSIGVTVHVLDLLPGKLPSPKMFSRLVTLVRQIRPDVIQGWMYHGNIAAQLAAFFIFRKLPVIWNIQHSVEAIIREKKSTQQAIRFCAWLSRFPLKIVYVSTVAKQQHELLGYARKKNCVITNGVDTSLFIPAEKRRVALRQELNLEADALLIGLFARYHPMKDHQNFLKAAGLLQEKYSGLHFLLAGTNINDTNEPLNTLIHGMGIRHIRLLGERTGMESLVAAMDIVILSSSFGESSPVILLESMSCGVPCISTDVGDAKNIIGDTGIVISPRNHTALADAIDTMLGEGAGKRSARGMAARERIVNDYSLRSVIDQYEKLYQGEIF